MAIEQFYTSPKMLYPKNKFLATLLIYSNYRLKINWHFFCNITAIFKDFENEFYSARIKFMNVDPLDRYLISWRSNIQQDGPN